MESTMTEAVRASSDFAALARRVNQAGLMERRPRYYALRFTLVGAMLAGSWVAFFWIGDSWLQVATAVVMAIVSGQIALLGHDVAHRQVFRTRRPSDRVGMVTGDLAIGLGYGWWQDKHTRHHANPNHEELDPDVEPSILVWSQEQARQSEGVTRFIGARGALLYFPLLTLAGVNLHVSAIKSVFNPAMKHRALEAVLLFVHFAAYLTAVFLVLSPGKAVVFVVVHKALWGLYMGSIFAPNHKGMPTYSGDQNPDFLRKQVLTSRNVKGSRFTDVALGGLNYQIEHHLFPAMPTPHLRRAKPIVRDFCDELGVDYHETGLLESYREALRELHRNGAPIREASRNADSHRS
ncbi:fatty acid desaturase family protein [Glycomyces tarimensis]